MNLNHCLYSFSVVNTRFVLHGLQWNGPHGKQTPSSLESSWYRIMEKRP